MATTISESNKLTFTGYFRNIYEAFYTCGKGMWITFKYVWAHKPVTIEYPEVKEVLPEKARMRLFNDAENCISCTQCALSCPVDCIYIASKPRPKGEEVPKTTNGSPIRQILTQYTIDTALCCYCGLCTTVCPTECLTHSHDYEYSQYSLSGMKVDYLNDDVRAWRERIVKE
ncbi:MAG: 4Fe-4S binding protein [Bacteriovoracaceae bacterium]|jgi:NADH-quinone oxidoreductase subunit I|nr:4Fe-4S binding protein [Bacteriovoracaceae bacterium]